MRNITEKLPAKIPGINKRTYSMFMTLTKEPLMKGMTLVGGTALALQIQHRDSQYLDFAVFGNKLPANKIDALMTKLEKAGVKYSIIEDHNKTIEFRINTGGRLSDYARDYAINGVKVTFFVLGDNDKQKDYFRSAVKLKLPDVSFDVLGIEGLKIAKTIVLAHRVKSRDIYDLMILCKNYGYTISKLFDNFSDLSMLNDPNQVKMILNGKMPLDADDEGLHGLATKITMPQIYSYFNGLINRYEKEMTVTMLSAGISRPDR